MNEVMIDIRNYDLADRLKLDMISVDSLLRELEDALDRIDFLNDRIEELKKEYEPDAFDEWHDRVIENDR